MVPLIVSDNPVSITRLRGVLAGLGHDCPLSHVVSLEAAPDAVPAFSPAPTVVLFELGGDRFRAETTLRTLRSSTRARILALGVREPGSILGAIHAGADDYIDQNDGLIEQLKDSLSRMTDAARNERSDGQIVTVISGSGGTGCTTIATNLAVLWARLHGQCGLIDLDLRSGDAATLLDLKPKHTLADLCRAPEKLDCRMFEQSLAKHDSGVHLIPAPPGIDDMGQVTTEGIAHVLSLARSTFSRTVVDLSDVTSEFAKQLLPASSRILLICRLDLAAVLHTRRILDYLGRLAIDRDRARIIVNRFGLVSQLEVAKVQPLFDAPISGCLPDDPRAVLLSANCGNPCVLELPQSKFATAMVEVADVFDESGLKASTASVSDSLLMRAREAGQFLKNLHMSWFAPSSKKSVVHA